MTEQQPKRSRPLPNALSPSQQLRVTVIVVLILSVPMLALCAVWAAQNNRWVEAVGATITAVACLLGAAHIDKTASNG